MLDEIAGLAAMQDVVKYDANFPFILAAGERRLNTANCAIRDPAWLDSADATSLAILFVRRDQTWRVGWKHREDRYQGGRSDG